MFVQQNLFHFISPEILSFRKHETTVNINNKHIFMTQKMEECNFHNFVLKKRKQIKNYIEII